MKSPNASQADSLTGLFNQKTFQEEYESALLYAKTHKQPLSLALVDVDYFKTVNDTYGHLIGDRVLETIASTLTEKLPEESIISRYGGDEFAVLFPGLEREQAFLSLEQARAAMESKEIQAEPNQEILRGVPLSGGVASFPVDGSSGSELMRKADQALYRAKVSGRNKIRLAYEEKMVPKTAHYTQTQLERLSKLAGELSVGEAELLREGMDDLLIKYGINDIES